MPWSLMGGEVLAHVGSEFVLVDLHAGYRTNERRHLFSPLLIGQTDHGDVGDLRPVWNSGIVVSHTEPSYTPMRSSAWAPLLTRPR